MIPDLEATIATQNGGARLLLEPGVMEPTARMINLPQDLEQEIAREAERRGQTWSSVTTDMLTEAIRMRRVPGIVFGDGPTGRRAVVAGSGIDVWEVIATWQESSGDFEALRQNYDWLSEAQLRAALRYFELYPEEIQARLQRERQWTPETIRLKPR